MTKSRCLVAALLALANPSQATPVVSGDGACGVRAVDNESFLTCEGERAPLPAGAQDAGGGDMPAALPISARQAVQMKADLGSRVLLADIRAQALDLHLLERLDDALLAGGLRHGDPVVLLARTAEQGRLAAELMREHGYLQVFTVSDRDEDRLAAQRSGAAP